MANIITSKNAELAICEMAIAAANEMSKALNIISDLLPANGKRCDKRFYDKVADAFKAAGCAAKFYGQNIRVYRSESFTYADIYPSDIECANVTLSQFYTHTHGGIMRDVDTLRNQIAACAERCAKVGVSAQNTTAAQIDAFITKYEELRKQYEALRKNAPFGISCHMDHLGSCPIY